MEIREPRLDWLTKHIREVFLGTIIMLLGWQVTISLEMKQQQNFHFKDIQTVTEKAKENAVEIRNIKASWYTSKDADQDRALIKKDLEIIMLKMGIIQEDIQKLKR